MAEQGELMASEKVTITKDGQTREVTPGVLPTWERRGWTAANTAPTTVTVTHNFYESDKNDEITVDATTEAELEEEQDPTTNQAETREF
jgi:hypothetical protein